MKISFKAGLLAIVPPWLRRTWGTKLLESFGERGDDLRDRVVDGVKLRFPGHDPDAIDGSALALIGRERRILRGPEESDAAYAERLRTWWDAHLLRGGPYALLEQLRQYFAAFLDYRLVTQDGDPIITGGGVELHTGFRIDLVYYSGTRYLVDELGTVTKDAITWSADGSGLWARIWIIFYPIVLPAVLVTETGAALVTDDSRRLIADVLRSSPLLAMYAEVFLAVAREWRAAHNPFATVVLLYDNAQLWDYPVPVGPWDEPGGTWTSDPHILIAQ